MFEFNKKLIFKKFFLDNTYYFLLSIFCITLIVWVIQAVNYLDFVTEDGHGLAVYFKYMLFSIPKIISKLMLLIFFVTFFYTLSKFEDTNELKIFWLNGINVKRFIINILNYSAIFVLTHILLSVFIVPTSQNKARTFIQSSNIDFFPSLITERKFIDTVEGLTIYIQNKSDFKSYDNIFLKDTKEKGKVKIIYAKKGILENVENKPKLILFDGKIINVYGQDINNFNFEKTIFDLSKYITKSTTVFKIQELSTKILISCYVNYHLLNNKEFFDLEICNDASLKTTQEELNKRIIKPLYYFSIAICICFLLLFSKEKTKYKLYRTNIFLFAFLILLISEISTSLSGESFVNLYASIFLPIFIFFISLIYLNLKFIKY